MHKIFITEGIVLRKRGVGEASTLVVLLTEELGLLRASARSARLGRSKLRYGLEAFTRGRFSLVRGKYEWRLIGVEHVSHEYIAGTLVRRRAVARIGKLLLRLINGEEPLPPLYRVVREGLVYIAKSTDQHEAENIECVLVLRILSHLGYLPQTPEIAPFTQSDFFSIGIAAEAARSRRHLIRAINESLSATGL